MRSHLNKLLPLTLLVFIGFWFEVAGQSDSLKQEIFSYRDSTAETIAKGRKLLMDKFLLNDKKKVAELLTYLESVEKDQNFLAFFPTERWFLYYWIERYDPLMSDLANYDEDYHRSIDQKLGPARDSLYLKLRSGLRVQRFQIIENIQRAELSDTEKAFLILNLDYFITAYAKTINRDSLNHLSNEYLTSYPQSRFENYVRKYIRFEMKNSKWGLGFEFFSGYGAFTGHLRKNFKNHVPFGVAFDVCYMNFTLFLRDYIGLGSTNDSIPFKDGTWRKDAKASTFLPEASIGYTVVENKIIKLVPFLGIASMEISPSQSDIKKYPEYENVHLKLTTTYTFGLNLDFKIAKAKKVINRPNERSYWFLRLRYAYNKPQFEQKYNRFNGDFHYITIGIGALGRQQKEAFKYSDNL